MPTRRTQQQPEPHGENAAQSHATGTVARLKALRRKFGLDQHRLMERFTVTTAVFAVALVGIVSAAAGITIRNNIEQLSTQSLYTLSFSTSRSDQDGEVLGMERSPDGTRAVIWMSFDSMDALSADAQTYQVFVTGGTLQGGTVPTQQRVTGRYVVYGSSGVMAIVLDSQAGPLASELLAVTVRAGRELAETTAEIEVAAGDSFTMYDQWRLFENPGAAETAVDPALAGAGQDFDAVAFHRTHVAAIDVAEIRQEAQQQLALIKVDLSRIEEYTQRVSSARYGSLRLALAQPPAGVTGDTVVGEPGSLVFQAATTVPGGYDFVVRADDTLDGYADQQASTAPLAGPSLWAQQTTWLFTDGTPLEMVSSDVGASGVRTAVAELEAVWADAWEAKRTYQSDVLGGLVKVARQQRVIEQAISVNASAVKTY